MINNENGLIGAFAEYYANGGFLRKAVIVLTAPFWMPLFLVFGIFFVILGGMAIVAFTVWVVAMMNFFINLIGETLK